MRVGIAAVALLVGLAACSSAEPLLNDATPYLTRDIYQTRPGDQCPASVWITGEIVRPSGIQDDKGVVYGLMWGGMNTAHVAYGRRYKIGGAWFGNPGGTLWACAGAEAVIPQ